MNRRESTRMNVARRRAPSRRALDRRRARPPRVASRFARRRARASRAVARAVARCGLLLLLFLRLNIRYIQRIIRTQSTITTWITRVIVYVILYVHTRMSECSIDPASRRRGVGTRRRALPTRCERCGAFERDSRAIRDAREPSLLPPNADRRATTARRSRRAGAVPTARWIRGDADGRRRRDGVDAHRRGRDSKIRRLARIRRASSGRRDARARRRATEEGSRARGARGRARDDEGRRGEKK